MCDKTDTIGTATPTKPLTGMRGADILEHMLRQEGVEYIFGFPGGQVIPIFDALYDSKLKFIQSRHEQGASHMADGYARATGRVGVCLATSGPGATNIVTGLATANMDCIPMVAITGQVRSAVIGTDAFQEADITGISRPVVKHSYLVKQVDDIARVVHEAFHVAKTGRPGPVLVDICVDATSAKLQTETSLEMRLPGYRPHVRANIGQIRAAAKAINEAQRPVLYVGGGVILSGATELIRKMVDKGKLPVTTTLLGLGVIDETHPLSLKMLGMHGSAAANYSVQQSDCLIAVGARFDDRVTGVVEKFAPNATIIHIDVDPANISKNVEVDIPVVGDAKETLEKLVPLIEAKDRTPWLNQIAEWQQKYPFHYTNHTSRLKPQQVIERLGQLTNHDAIVATGVGQHQMWSAQYYGWRHPRQIISSGGLGTMGFGCPAAIGAQFGNPGKLVLDIDGDGSFCMTMAEVITAVKYQQPVKFVVLDNNYLGMVRQWQELFWKKRYSGVQQPDVDFVKVAEGFGAKGIRISDPGELDDALTAMIQHDGPVVL
ncbi:MAG TPA: biosynthetic-type acetolactate synthase large subunit, partial [Tepidisphaeraceae bacterium]|nr:biosynthetic-type acetolactate synthase large subunit [Tepidisphaeraceae bacterium]